MINKIITYHSLNVKNISDCKTTPLHKPKSRLAASHHLHRLRKFRRHFAPHAFWGGGYGGGALQCTRARGAPQSNPVSVETKKNGEPPRLQLEIKKPSPCHEPILQTESHVNYIHLIFPASLNKREVQP